MDPAVGLALLEVERAMQLFGLVMGEYKSHSCTSCFHPENRSSGSHAHTSLGELGVFCAMLDAKCITRGPSTVVALTAKHLAYASTEDSYLAHASNAHTLPRLQGTCTCTECGRPFQISEQCTRQCKL
jgi:hypothetical protein